MSAAVERPDLVVSPVGDHRRQLRVLAKKMLADVGAVLGFEVLVLAVDGLLHPPEQNAGGVAGDELVPAGSPQHLDHVPAGAAEDRLQLLNDLAIAADRAIQALQVAVDNENQIVEFFARGHRDRAERFGFVGLTIAQECPHLASRRVGQPAEVEVFEEPGLVDRHDWSQAHRHRRELPEVGHEPRVGVGRQPLATDLLAEIEELLFAEAALQKSARVDTGRRMALDVDQVPVVLLRRGVPEPHEADVVQRGGRLEAGDVTTQLRRLLVGPQYRRSRVPADQ